jgi:hypothetical protein
MSTWPYSASVTDGGNSDGALHPEKNKVSSSRENNLFICGTSLWRDGSVLSYHYIDFLSYLQGVIINVPPLFPRDCGLILRCFLDYTASRDYNWANNKSGKTVSGRQKQSHIFDVLKNYEPQCVKLLEQTRQIVL